MKYVAVNDLPSELLYVRLQCGNAILQRALARVRRIALRELVDRLRRAATVCAEVAAATVHRLPARVAAQIHITDC